MRSQRLSPYASTALAAGFAALACAACASSGTGVTGLTSVTSANVAGPASPARPATGATSAPPEAATPPQTEPAAEPPAGHLECRAKSPFGNTFELYLTWDGPNAHAANARGTLLAYTPSGVVTSRTVRAERYNGMIIADDVGETDVVVHAATVRSQGGAKFMVLTGIDQASLTCQ